MSRGILHRFRLSNVVVNVGGFAELNGYYHWTKKDILLRFPSAALVHGPLAKPTDQQHGLLGLGTAKLTGPVKRTAGRLVALPCSGKAEFERSLWLRDRPIDETCSLEIELALQCEREAGVLMELRDNRDRKLYKKKIFGQADGSSRRAKAVYAFDQRYPYVRLALEFYASPDQSESVTVEDVVITISRDQKVAGRKKKFFS